jgi:hypothetical protein
MEKNVVIKQRIRKIKENNMTWLSPGFLDQKHLKRITFKIVYLRDLFMFIITNGSLIL